MKKELKETVTVFADIQCTIPVTNARVWFELMQEGFLLVKIFFQVRGAIGHYSLRGLQNQLGNLAVIIPHSEDHGRILGYVKPEDVKPIVSMAKEWITKINRSL